MKAQVKADWLAALRSGDYKQTQGRLRRDEGFCCMGVLCDVIDPSKWRHELHELFSNHATWSYGDLALFPSVSVLPPVEILFNHRNVLSCMNDTKGLSFTEIADWIEQNIEEDS